MRPQLRDVAVGEYIAGQIGEMNLPRLGQLVPTRGEDVVGDESGPNGCSGNQD